MSVSKSYQNCAETEVPGYNDCPSFLFFQNKPIPRRKHRVVSEPPNMGSMMQAPTSLPAPPIISHKRHHVQTQDIKASKSLSKEEILHKVNELYTLKSNLLAKEFEFYKRKVESNLIISLENASTRKVMTRFFEEAQDKPKASNTLRAWMSTDVSVIKWCPAFLKIFEHTQCA